MCDSCLAACGQGCPDGMNYKNTSDHAAWRETMIDHRQYLAMPGPHSVWRCVPGWKLETLAFDLMHNIYLGTGRDLVASAIRTLVRQGVYTHVSDNMETVFDHIHKEVLRDTKAYGFLKGTSFEVGGKNSRQPCFPCGSQVEPPCEATIERCQPGRRRLRRVIFQVQGHPR